MAALTLVKTEVRGLVWTCELGKIILSRMEGKELPAKKKLLLFTPAYKVTGPAALILLPVVEFALLIPLPSVV